MSSAILRLAFLVVVAVGTVAQTEIPCARTYTVRPGDTCDAIAADQGVSSWRRPIPAPSTKIARISFRVRQVICLQRVCLDCNDVHVVAAGDTCTSIADEAGITVPTLEANNPNIAANCDIRAGQVLCVAQSL
ncbi:hypothetical protein PC9H_005732 [Pleurotus ostreatus]|uniref:LysM domain-containing protein n=1 Tax=Pleurotus ostreatus TaxID=5322 RepID=A0A8H6ZX00_PLEOS|nr:uncharacterized protein PC9H_005732 [Pleurotus ostreatus]KAF7433767.1 hypothetical protein PC9H_005732 [Pleurotus ostreatus]